MTDQPKIPEHILKRGLAMASGSTVFGVPLEELSKDELMAVAALGWSNYNREIRLEAMLAGIPSDQLSSPASIGMPSCA
ncbi:hypothetical protein [Pseudomonas pseudonitroreducens]|uniref:hypothetical protein n=1 Tax=Pseudomonas pseudonitroreducens TaxID=2892326 RepID=UPI001F425A48|nr:hypothetical protein [Pseudomonas pseudonitroreducens]